MKTDRQLRQEALNRLADHVATECGSGRNRLGNVRWGEESRWVAVNSDTCFGLDYIQKLQAHLGAEEVYLSGKDEGELELCLETVKIFPWER
jgi:hypothetical protein